MKIIHKLCFILIIFFVAYSSYSIGFAPHKYQNISKNKKYLLTVFPPDEKNKLKSQIIVSLKKGNKWDEIWKVTAINKVQPAEAYITNDGTSVLTLSNWYGKDEGKDALVIYKQGKFFKQYSIDDLLGGHFEPGFHSIDGPAEWLWHKFVIYDGNSEFAVWVDFVRKWVVVNIENGEIIKPSQKQLKKFEEIIREYSYNAINDGEWTSYTHYRNLALFLRPEDKPLFEELLTYPDLNLSCGFGGNDDSFSYVSSHQYRELAEMVLDAFDQKKTDAIYSFNRDNYKRLGSLSIYADFKIPISKEDGIIVLWLEEIKNGEISKLEKRPTDSIGIELNFAFPYDLGKANKPMNGPLDITMYGVNPGKYRVCGYWDKKTKIPDSIEDVFWKRRVSPSIIRIPEVEIFKGKNTEVKVLFSTQERDLKKNQKEKK